MYTSVYNPRREGWIVSNEWRLLPSPGNPEGSDLAQLYQADLARIGVTLNIQTLEMAIWPDQIDTRKYRGLYYASSANLQMEPGTASAVDL